MIATSEAPVFFMQVVPYWTTGNIGIEMKGTREFKKKEACEL